MRSVTFADEKVVDFLNERFILVWNNHMPEEGGGGDAGAQPTFSAEELERYPEGGGGGNVRTYVGLADGRIVHYVSGWYRPERYLEELALAIGLDEQNAVQKHREHVAAHGRSAQAVRHPHAANVACDFASSAECRRAAMLGVQAQLHAMAENVLLQPVEQVLEQARRENLERGVIK